MCIENRVRKGEAELKMVSNNESSKESATRLHQLRLVSVTENHLQYIFEWGRSDEAFGPFDEPGHQSLDFIRTKWETGGYSGTWIVEQAEKPIGFCNYTYHPWCDWIAVIAVIIAVPAMRGRGLGTEIHKRVIKTVFARDAAIQKIEAYTDSENYAEQAALTKAGFEREGLLRRSGLIRGEIRDMYVYGLLKEGL